MLRGRPADAGPVEITLTAHADHAMIRLTVTDTGAWRPPPADREQPAPGTRGHPPATAAYFAGARPGRSGRYRASQSARSAAGIGRPK